MPKLSSGALLVLGAAFCWSISGACIKTAQTAFDSAQISGLRSGFALLFLCAVIRPWRGKLIPRPVVLLLSAVYAGMLVLFVQANLFTTSANAIFLQDTAPVWVSLLAPLALKEPFRLRDVGYLLACVGGIGLLFVGEVNLEAAPGQAPLLGNGLAICSGLMYAIVVMGLRWGRAKTLPTGTTPQKGPTEAEQIVLWGNLFGMLACIPFMGHFAPETQLGTPLAIVALLGIVQLGLGYYLFTLGVTHVPAAQAAMLGLLEPVLNPVWAYFFAHESPTPWALAGGFVILASVTLMSLRKE